MHHQAVHHGLRFSLSNFYKRSHTVVVILVTKVSLVLGEYSSLNRIEIAPTTSCHVISEQA